MRRRIARLLLRWLGIEGRLAVIEFWQQEHDAEHAREGWDGAVVPTEGT